MDKIDKFFNTTGNFIYEWGFNIEYLNKYYLPTEFIEKIFTNAEDIDMKMDKDRLIYLRREGYISAPQKHGLPGVMGGTKGMHKAKVTLMLWYFYRLKLRGLSSQEIKNHIYTYFADTMPPKPVKDTPLEERIIYTFRINKRMPSRLFRLYDFEIMMEGKKGIKYFPCKKLVVYKYEGKKDPLYSVLMPTRNLTRTEMDFILELRKNRSFKREEGIKIQKMNNGEIETKYELDLTIYKQYPLTSRKNDECSYKDLIITNRDRDSI